MFAVPSVLPCVPCLSLVQLAACSVAGGRLHEDSFSRWLPFRVAGNFLFSDRNIDLGVFSNAVFNLSRNYSSITVKYD